MTGRDMVLVTVLGSCVAACLWDRVTGLGGMNHFMLPDDLREGGTPLSVAGRYGAYAMELMINRLLKAGARRGRLEAKVFGGAEVLRDQTPQLLGQQFEMMAFAKKRGQVVVRALINPSHSEVPSFR